MKPPTTGCRFGRVGCGRRIAFIRTPEGRRMPIDPEPDEDGTVAVFRDAAGVWVGRVIKAGERPEPYERLFMTHFATCTAKAHADAAVRSEKIARGAGVTVLNDHRVKRGGRGYR